MEKNLLFFRFLVMAYAAKEFVISVKNRFTTVINAVLKNFLGHVYPAFLSVAS